MTVITVNTVCTRDSFRPVFAGRHEEAPQGCITMSAFSFDKTVRSTHPMRVYPAIPHFIVAWNVYVRESDVHGDGVCVIRAVPASVLCVHVCHDNHGFTIMLTLQCCIPLSHHLSLWSLGCGSCVMSSTQSNTFELRSLYSHSLVLSLTRHLWNNSRWILLLSSGDYLLTMVWGLTVEAIIMVWYLISALFEFGNVVELIRFWRSKVKVAVLPCQHGLHLRNFPRKCLQIWQKHGLPRTQACSHSNSVFNSQDPCDLNVPYRNRCMEGHTWHKCQLQDKIKSKRSAFSHHNIKAQLYLLVGPLFSLNKEPWLKSLGSFW